LSREATIYRVEVKVDQSGNIYLDKTIAPLKQIREALADDESGIAIHLCEIVSELDSHVIDFGNKFL
jgi:hypothetical protein